MSASGRIVASVDHGRGYVDVVRYERQADAIVGAHVDVVSDDVVDAVADDERRVARPPVTADGREALEESLRVAHHR